MIKVVKTLGIVGGVIGGSVVGSAIIKTMKHKKNNTKEIKKYGGYFTVPNEEK